ncbi:MAG: AraC family transcriptional regulator ligand-binding domain-containing protein [Pseudomonadota bacterium]
MSDALPTVYVAGINAVLQAAAAKSVDSRQLALDAAINPDLLQLVGERIPVEDYRRVFDLAEARTGDPGLGLAVGHITFFTGMNLHLYMSTICRTLKEYLNVIPSTIKLHGDVGRVLIRPKGDYIRLEWHPEDWVDTSWRCLVDAMLSAAAMIVGAICALPVPVRAAEFSYARPADCRSLESVFGRELRFEQPVSCLYFDREAVHLPLIDLDYELSPDFKALPESLFEEPDQADIFLRDTRDTMRRALPGGELTIDILAEQMSISRRTLQRRLNERDTSFKELLLGLREELSLRYLGDGRLAVTEIALLLGYSDQASFSNAFKAWRGCSPTEYRKSR